MKPVSPLLISRSRARLFKSFVLAAGNETSFDQDSVRHVAKRYWFVQVWQGSWGDRFAGIFFGVVFAVSWSVSPLESLLAKIYTLGQGLTGFDSLWNSLLEFRSLWWWMWWCCSSRNLCLMSMEFFVIFCFLNNYSLYIFWLIENFSSIDSEDHVINRYIENFFIIC